MKLDKFDIVALVGGSIFMAVLHLVLFRYVSLWMCVGYCGGYLVVLTAHKYLQ